jgi:UDP-arabinose 4-epimerase
MSAVVLVTGGAGYIGSHACKALAACGMTPVSVDNLSRGHDWAVKWGPLEQGDLRDRAFLAEVFERHRPDAVMHFAAFAYVGESVEHPELYRDNNIGGADALLDIMRDAGCKRLVFSSSCTVYGVPVTVPITESHPRRPVNPYGEGKYYVEQRLEEAADAWGLGSVSLRYFNAAGSDPDGEIGESHEPETHAIPNALIAAIENLPFGINGTDYPTPDGTCVRDYVHVSDLANAHVLALEYLQAGGESTAFNLGTGEGSSVLDVVRAAEAASGRRIEIAKRPRRAGDPPLLVAAAERARSQLGWQPRYPELSVQVAHAWNWISRQR